jgi:hypothetical protein
MAGIVCSSDTLSGFEHHLIPVRYRKDLKFITRT